MNVGFGLVREVEVDNEGDVFDIDSARRDIGRNEDGEAAAAEFIEGFVALFLAAIAVDGLGLDVVLLQIAAQFVGPVFGAGKDDGELASGEFFELIDEKRAFVVFGNEADELIHFLGGGRLRSDGDGGRIFEDGVGQLAHGGGEGGREKERLAFFRQKVDDFLHVAQETHVQHAIHFVEDEKFDAREVEVVLVVEIKEATGAGHEDIDALAHGLDLRTFADAAVDESVADFEVLAVSLEAFADLGGEFAGGSEDEDADGFATRVGWVFVEGVEDGNGKSGRFSGAGLSAADEVAPSEEEGNGLGLDRRGDGVILVAEGFLDGGSQRHVREGTGICHNNWEPGTLSIGAQRGSTSVFFENPEPVSHRARLIKGRPIGGQRVALKNATAGLL